MMSKKMFAGAMTLAAAAAVMFAANVDTEAASRRIYIDGSRIAWVGRTIELDADGAFDDDYVRDSNIVWTSSKPSVAKVLRKRGDDTRIKARKAGTAKITVRIKGTSLKATMKLKVKKTANASRKWNKSNGSNSDSKKLAKYRKQIQKISAGQRRTLYYSYARQLDAIDRKLDRLNDKWDDRWGWTAERMDDAIDRVEDYLDDVEDYLEDKFDWDDDWDDWGDDDDWYDDDRHDDWDDDDDDRHWNGNHVNYRDDDDDDRYEHWDDDDDDDDDDRWDDDDD